MATADNFLGSPGSSDNAATACGVTRCPLQTLIVSFLFELCKPFPTGPIGTSVSEESPSGDVVIDSLTFERRTKGSGVSVTSPESQVLSSEADSLGVQSLPLGLLGRTEPHKG